MKKFQEQEVKEFTLSLPVNSIIHGDSLEIMKLMPDKSVDLIITDPPYGMNFQSGHRKVKYEKIVGDTRFPVEIFNELFRIARKGVYVFCRWDNIGVFPKPKSVLCWVKNNWSMGDLEHEHGRQWEAICFYAMEEHVFIKRIPDVIREDRTGNVLHPTEKPVNLIKKIIMANEGDVIFDPFCGSGTTLVAAKQEGRQYLGIEIDEKFYCEAKERVEHAQIPMFL